MIKEHQAAGKGTGGQSVTGTQNRVDSSPTNVSDHGVTEQTKGGDPYTAHKPGALPGHMSELSKHSGTAAKGGSSQAGSVGGYEGK